MDFEPGVIEVIGAVLAAAVLWLIKENGERIKLWAGTLARSVLWAGDDRLTEGDIKLQQQVNDLLLELRVRAGASRAYIDQFHNGQWFSPRAPVWRMSMTHERCAPGVSSIVESQRNIPVSTVLDYVSFLWSCDRCPDGVAKVPVDPPLSSDVFVFVIPQLAESQIKLYFMNSGIHTLLMTALRDARDHEHIVGLVGIDFCFDVGLDGIPRYADCLAKAASSIGILLSQQGQVTK